jgi:hypothetical protein
MAQIFRNLVARSCQHSYLRVILKGYGDKTRLL